MTHTIVLSRARGFHSAGAAPAVSRCSPHFTSPKHISFESSLPPSNLDQILMVPNVRNCISFQKIILWCLTYFTSAKSQRKKDLIKSIPALTQGCGSFDASEMQSGPLRQFIWSPFPCLASHRIASSSSQAISSIMLSSNDVKVRVMPHLHTSMIFIVLFTFLTEDLMIG